MDSQKQEIVAWFEQGCIYDAGVSLYEKYGTSRILLKNLSRLRNDAMGERLKYELCKIANLDESILDKSSISMSELPIKKQRFSAIHVNNEWPEEVSTIIKKRNKAGHERAKLHNSLLEIPVANTRANMDKRRTVLTQINELTAEYESLDSAVTEFIKTGVVVLPEKVSTTADASTNTPPASENRFIAKLEGKSATDLLKYMTQTLKPMKSRYTKEVELLSEDSEKRTKRLATLAQIEEAIACISERIN